MQAQSPKRGCTNLHDTMLPSSQERKHLDVGGDRVGVLYNANDENSQPGEPDR